MKPGSGVDLAAVGALREETMPWKTFLKAHWGAIAAADFFSVEVLTRPQRGRRTEGRGPYFPYVVSQ